MEKEEAIDIASKALIETGIKHIPEVVSVYYEESELTISFTNSEIGKCHWCVCFSYPALPGGEHSEKTVLVDSVTKNTHIPYLF